MANTQAISGIMKQVALGAVVDGKSLKGALYLVSATTNGSNTAYTATGELAATGKPWFLAVNLVNPHDVMFFNSDLPGQDVQSRNILGHIEREPANPLYAKQWQFELPARHGERLDAAGRPRAHADFLRSHDTQSLTACANRLSCEPDGTLPGP